MRNLLIITQKVDENDDLLGFFVSWLREFSKRFDKVFVITLLKGGYDLPDNVYVYSLGKEKSALKLWRFFKLYFYLFRLVPKSSGIFCHMSPIFAIAAWPVAFIFRERIVLWYLHRSVTLRLKLSEKIVSSIVTATKESLNIESKKIIEIGHGIDIDRFRADRNWDNLNSRQFRILSVGRISPIKDYETLIKAAGILKEKGFDFRLKIVGRPVMVYDFEYFEKLKKLVQGLKLENFIEFMGFIPFSQIADYYKEADILINLAPKGGIDKVVLEAMASGSLVLVSNTAFKKYFGEYDLFFKHGEPEDLAGKIIKLINLPNGEIKNTTDFLFRSVSQNHN